MASPESQAIATKLILNLTGRRWTWPRKRVVEEYQLSKSVSHINLVGRPVSGVNSVTDRLGNSYQFQLSDGFRLRLPQFDWSYYELNTYASYDTNGGIYLNWRRWGLFLTVDYVYGNPPPLDVQRAIDEFAEQLDLASEGKSCALPERVTSIAREGLSLTVLDPTQFLEGGKTGLYYPDLVISSYGSKTGRVMARAKVYSPEYAPPRRLSSQTLYPDTLTIPPETGENSVPLFPFTNEYARGIDIGADWRVTITAPTAVAVSSVQAQIKSLDGMTTVVTWDETTPGNGIVTVVGNTITLAIDDAVTSVLTPGTYAYDLFATVDTVRRKLVQGAVDINAAVTT